MSKEEAEELLLKCVLEVQKRLVINLPSFSFYFVDEAGVSSKKTIKTELAKVSEDQPVEDMDVFV